MSTDRPKNRATCSSFFFFKNWTFICTLISNLRKIFYYIAIILCESLYNMHVFVCGVSAWGKPRSAKGIRGQQPCDRGFRDWFSADVTSASLPLPSSSPLSPSHSLPLSASLSLCTALLFFLLCLSSASPLSEMACVGAAQASRA